MEHGTFIKSKDASLNTKLNFASEPHGIKMINLINIVIQKIKYMMMMYNVIRLLNLCIMEKCIKLLRQLLSQ